MIELYDKEFKKKVNRAMIRHKQDPFFEIREVDSLLEESEMNSGFRQSQMKGYRSSSCENHQSTRQSESELNNWVVQNKLKHRGQSPSNY